MLFIFWRTTEKRGLGSIESFFLMGGGGCWSEVSTKGFLTPRTVKMSGEIAGSPVMREEMP